jgi:serine/threonine protein kinase
MDQGKQFTEKEILRILTMLSVALAYIGSKNVVHRDIKPANILISTIGERRVYKLTDFGIAQNDYENKL